jgi:hypothetical protein
MPAHDISQGRRWHSQARGSTIGLFGLIGSYGLHSKIDWRNDAPKLIAGAWLVVMRVLMGQTRPAMRRRASASSAVRCQLAGAFVFPSSSVMSLPSMSFAKPSSSSSAPTRISAAMASICARLCCNGPETSTRLSSCWLWIRSRQFRMSHRYPHPRPGRDHRSAFKAAAVSTGDAEAAMLTRAPPGSSIRIATPGTDEGGCNSSATIASAKREPATPRETCAAMHRSGWSKHHTGG